MVPVRPLLLLTLLLATAGCGAEERSRESVPPSVAARVTVEARVIQVIATSIGIRAGRPRANDRLEDLGGDELNRVEIVMDLEDEFDIQIAEEEALGLVRVRDFLAIVHRKLAAKLAGP